MKKQETYEEKVLKLETIVKSLESEEVGISELADKITNAKKLLLECREYLKDTEEKVKKLVQ